MEKQIKLNDYQVDLLISMISKDMYKNQLCIESYGVFRKNVDCQILIKIWKAENDILNQLKGGVNNAK